MWTGELAIITNTANKNFLSVLCVFKNVPLLNFTAYKALQFVLSNYQPNIAKNIFVYKEAF